MELHRGNHFAQSVGQGRSGLQFVELRFGLFHLPNRQEQRRAINPFGIGIGLALLRVKGQRLEQVAVAVGGQRRGEGLSRIGAQAQLIGVHNRRVVQTPLNDIDGVDDRGFSRSFARFNDALLAGFQIQLPALAV